MRKKFTRATRKDSESKQTKSSIADHVANEHHLINWEESNILAKVSERIQDGSGNPFG